MHVRALTSEVALTLAPASMRADTTSGCGSASATCSAVKPSCVRGGRRRRGDGVRLVQHGGKQACVCAEVRAIGRVGQIGGSRGMR